MGLSAFTSRWLQEQTPCNGGVQMGLSVFTFRWLQEQTLCSGICFNYSTLLKSLKHDH